MNLGLQTKRDGRNSELAVVERAKLACRLAKQHEKAGEYEAAWEALREFWPDRQQPPRLEELDEATRGEVLLRAGALAGWLGSAEQEEGTQETAKNLLTQSRDTFHHLGNATKEAEAHGELALCYWREGALDEARIQLRAALHLLPSGNAELRAVLLVRAGIIEATAGRYNESLRFYERATSDVEGSNDNALKGSLHISLATLFTRLAAVENRQDYSDRALIEYAASSFHYEQAGNRRAVARVENCLGYLFFTIGRCDDAYKHLDRARNIFLELNDIGTAAQVDETRARTLLAQGRLTEAERIVRSAVKTLERGGQQAVLAEALTTHGVVMARMGNYARARLFLQRAYEIAQTAGDLEGAGRARLCLIEELGGQTPAAELISIYRSALELLRETQDPSSRKRLMSCAENLLNMLAGSDEIDPSQPQTWEGFSFKQQIHHYERALLERALRDAGGSVTRAARLLGFSHHQSLISLLNVRHKELLKSRSATRKRRRHLFWDPKTAEEKKKSVLPNSVRDTSQILVLHVEDNQAVAQTIHELLSKEGMRVHSCTASMAAMELIKSDEHFNVLIVDNELPGLSGLELVLRARSLKHRRSTLIIMLSGDDCEREAWRAGVDAFLLKPKGVDKVASTINRLLTTRETKGSSKRLLSDRRLKELRS